MPLYDIPNSTSGVDSVLVEIAETVPSFIPMLLIFVYMVVLIGGSTSQKKRTGFSDLPLWSIIASIAVLMIALPMTMITGLITLQILGVVVVVVVLNGLWFFMSRNRYEI